MGSQDVFKDGHAYILLANNDKFVSRILRGDISYIEAEKTSIDAFCLFRATTLGNGKVVLKADDGINAYLSRIDRSGQHNIEAAKEEIDTFCMFDVEANAPGKWNPARYVHIKADNGMYWGIRERGSRHNIEACFDYTSNEATRFTVLEVQ